jgi:hypothetical protein
MAVVQHFPWIAEIGILVFVLAGIRLSFRVWKAKTPYSLRGRGTADPLSIKLVAAVIPSTIFFASLSVMLASGNWLEAKSHGVSVLAHVIFGISLLICICAVSSFIYIYARRVPDYLTPKAWRKPT